MEKRISNLVELKAEIAFLKLKRASQEIILKEKFSSPKKIIGTVFGLFKGDGQEKLSFKDYIPQDLVTLLTRLLVPGFLNGIVFKQSGFITKTLITILSQKAASKVNSDVVSSWFDTATDWLKTKISTPKRAPATGRPVLRDYGIPPDSETY